MTENNNLKEKMKGMGYIDTIINMHNEIHLNLIEKKENGEYDENVNLDFLEYPILAKKIKNDFKKANISKKEQKKIIDGWLYIAVSSVGDTGLNVLSYFLIKYLKADPFKKNEENNISAGELAILRIENENDKKSDARILDALTEASSKDDKKQSCLLI